MFVDHLLKTKKEYTILDKACFQHDMACGDCKELPRKTAFEEIIHDKAHNVAKNPKYDGYQRGFASMFINWFVNPRSESKHS